MPVSQRDKMCELFREHHGNEALICAEYANSERKGEVVRVSNTSKLTAEDYAIRLFKDGVRKEWIGVR